MTKKLLETFLKPNKGPFPVPVFLLNLKDSEALGLLSVLLYPPQHGRPLHSTSETVSITALVLTNPGSTSLFICLLLSAASHPLLPALPPLTVIPHQGFRPLSPSPFYLDWVLGCP